MDCFPGERPSTLARAGRQARGFGRGQSLTAGWAPLCWFWALYGARSPDEVQLAMLQKRLPEGAVRRCPAALLRLDSGRGGNPLGGSRKCVNLSCSKIAALSFSCRGKQSRAKIRLWDKTVNGRTKDILNRGIDVCQCFRSN